MKIHKTRNNFSQVIYRNGRRGLSPWATNKFGRDLLVALNTLHKVAFLSFDQNSESGDILSLFDSHLHFWFSVHRCTICEFHPPQSLPLPSQIFRMPLYCFFPKGTKRNKKEASYSLRPIKLYFQAGIVHADLKPANVLWSQEEVEDVFPTSDVYVDLNLKSVNLKGCLQVHRLWLGIQCRRGGSAPGHHPPPPHHHPVPSG